MEDQHQNDYQTNHLQDQQSATNVKNHIGLINSVITSSSELLITYKNEIEVFKQSLHLMKQKIVNHNEEIKNTTQPTLDAMLRDLRQGISIQKDENSKLQGQITDLKKEKAQLQQLIISCTHKVAFLESQVGQYS